MAGTAALFGSKTKPLGTTGEIPTNTPNHAAKVISLNAEEQNSSETISSKVASIKVIEVADLEKEFSGLSETELNKEIKKNNQMEREADLFNKANSGKLDAKNTQKMVQYIRVNRVLHQILLQRQIEDIERSIL